MEEALIKRVMPHDEEAESSVIGAMLLDNEAIMVASEMITGIILFFLIGCEFFIQYRLVFRRKTGKEAA